MAQRHKGLQSTIESNLLAGLVIAPEENPFLLGSKRKGRNGEQVQRVAKLALGRKKSVDFTGYWQRHVKDVGC